MTFVIFFSRNLAGVGRSISRGFFFTCAIVLLCSMLGAGVWIGMQLAAPTSVMRAEAEFSSLRPSAKELALLQQIGALSARLMRLEMEAKGLAQRMDVVSEFEQRMSLGDTLQLGPRAKTQPASAGGPLLKPEKSASSVDKSDNSAAHGKPDSTSALPSESAMLHIVQMAVGTADTATLVSLEQNLDKLSAALRALEQQAVKISSEHMAFPGRVPVATSRRGSGYGNRRDPFTFRMAFHSGIDFPAPKGTPIYASAGGVVVYAGVRKDYGNTVEIDHGAGLVTRYAHASKLTVKRGQIVMPGQLIAEVGSTGRSTGAHLHFEILKDGRFVNPKAYLSRF